MLAQPIADLIDVQVNKEFYSAYLYLDMANYYAGKGLLGYENWFKVQAQEEMNHAMLMRQYLQNNGVSPYKYALTPSSDPGYAVDHGGTYGSDSRKHIQLWDRTEQQAGLPS